MPIVHRGGASPRPSRRSHAQHDDGVHLAEAAETSAMDSWRVSAAWSLKRGDIAFTAAGMVTHLGTPKEKAWGPAAKAFEETYLVIEAAKRAGVGRLTRV